MNISYPVIIHPQDKSGFHFIEIPDFNGFTQGKDLADAIDMSKDYIELSIMEGEYRHQPIPKPSAIANIHTATENIIVSIQIDITTTVRP